MASLKTGTKAPEFSTIDQNGKQISLSDYKGKKVILYFYPKDNTPGCTAESCNLQENYSSLKRKGFVVLGVSADDEKSHKKFATKYNLAFPLLVDTDKKIIKAYKAWGKKNMYGKLFNGILRKTYVIDEQGIIEKVFEKVETKNHTEQIVAAFK